VDAGRIVPSSLGTNYEDDRLRPLHFLEPRPKRVFTELRNGIFKDPIGLCLYNPCLHVLLVFLRKEICSELFTVCASVATQKS
jgi:hypothetical protein